MVTAMDLIIYHAAVKIDVIPGKRKKEYTKEEDVRERRKNMKGPKNFSETTFAFLLFLDP